MQIKFLCVQQLSVDLYESGYLEVVWNLNRHQSFISLAIQVCHCKVI